MSVTPASANTKRQIRQSLERWKGSLSEAELPLFRSFVDDMVTRIRGPFFTQHSPLAALQHLEVAFRFAQVRLGSDQRIEIRPGAPKGALILTSMLDQAFIVDTTRLFLRRHNADYWGGFNVVYSAKRDAEGKLVSVGDGGEMEGLGYIESDEGDLLANVAASTTGLRDQLALARATSVDFKAMTRAVERMVEKFESAADVVPDKADGYLETGSFLKWLLRENFVFMGIGGEQALGIDRIEGPFKGSIDGDWPPAHPPGHVQVRKTRVESPVHRAGRIDEILVTQPGETPQQLLIRGMFTYRAVTQPSRHVPILRAVLGGILETQQSRPGSFRYKGIANVFDSLPTEFLFTASEKAIADMVDLVFEAEQQQEVGVTFLMTGPDSAFCLLALPKTQYGEELRRDVEAVILGGLKASYKDHGLFFGRFDTVLLHYYLTGVEYPGDDGVQAMIDQIRALATPWIAKLWHAFAEKSGEAVADTMVEAYGTAFPEAWVRQTPIDRTIADIEQLERLSGDKNLVAGVWSGRDGLSLTLYQAEDVYLTAIVPILDNFGLVVVDSQAFTVSPRGTRMQLEVFHVDPTHAPGKDAILSGSQRLVEALEAVFSGEIESDRFNELVLTGGLDWREVDVIRGLARYVRQLGVKLAVLRVQEILLSNPQVIQHLVGLFHARFDPDRKGDRNAAVAIAEEAVRDDLRRLKGYDEDLLFQSLLQLLLGMIRTNYYRTDKIFHYLSFKFDASKIAMMGARRPMFEIYVHHEAVEGVHLRFAKVARGGLRWSDREDYRTEVLGLVTTQQVKNVVIVPEGSKGGFYLKHPSRDPSVRRQEADRHYQTFIRGLLDLTDNGVGGQITRPPRVLCHDAPDPYLVVAADKGTAHLSDTANGLSLKYGHWLGDAFASGGSVGYDHKKVGITARGAWVLIKRHFAEIGKDPYKEPFTCVGIGDLSGDVFGNGLIESDQTKLLAAFNHMFIFLDPNPDPASSFAERLRLFKAERLGNWDNYDKSKISQGGGVFYRNAKSIPLSPEAQQMLGIHQSEAAPDDVIRQILLMEVDLLLNGGIGTYIKASTETHADADDRSCDAIRIDGNQVRAKIVGEGGNLGCTQRGRIEAAQNGVKLNNDAVDNSAGVDMSDHEVNLKILLDRVVQRGDMNYEGRNELLVKMTDQVATLVMADNDAHGRQMSRDEVRSKNDIFEFGRAIAFVEQHMGQSRDALRLPTEKELAKRAEAGIGLTRPELCVLSAWVKMYVYRELLRNNPKALPGYDELLITYFPTELQQGFAADIRDHMLANEIAMTSATTRMIADAGAAFFPMMVETTGCDVGQIAAAYLKAQTLGRVAEVRGPLEELTLGDAQAQRYRAWVTLDGGVRDVAAWWLSTRGEQPPDSDIAKMADAATAMWKALPAEAVAHQRAEMTALTAAGVPEKVARRVQEAAFLPVAVGAHSEAARLGIPLADMLVRHLAVARASRLQDVLDDIASHPAHGKWDPIALQILHDRFTELLRKLVAAIAVPAPVPAVDALAETLASGPVQTVRSQVDTLLGTGAPSIPTLIVLEERVAGRIARIGEAQA